MKRLLAAGIFWIGWMLDLHAGATNDVYSFVPEAASYSVVYELAIPNSSQLGATLKATYVTDRSTNFSGPNSFDRVAYYMELQATGGPLKWVYVSMDAFTTNARMIGVPSVATGALFQQNVANMNVYSSADANVTTGTSIQTGNIEFWGYNYTANNAANVPNASSAAYDSGDQISTTAYYGSMQIHNHDGVSQTIMAYNRFGYGGNSDVGIGNCPSSTYPDWTFQGTAPNYTVKNLVVLVRPVAVPDVLLTAAPKNSQLYARDRQTNRGTVPFSGTVRNAGFDSIVLKVNRNGVSYTNVVQPLDYGDGQAPFTISADIVAELANYDFKLYVRQGANDFQIATATSVVAGDAFLINGQSNAEAMSYSGSASANQHAFLRSFGTPGPTASSALTDLNWHPAIGDSRYTAGMAGQWGLKFGRLLLDTYQIPIAIINAAEPSQPITYFQRNDVTPNDVNTNYGRLLYRVQQAGLANGIRAILWYQGESDWRNSPNNPANHENGFLSLYQAWMSDYPNVERIYVHQVREVAVIDGWTEGLDLRNRQRLLQDSHSNISVMSTTGIDNYGIGPSSLHFGYTGGYETIGSNIFNLVRRDLYGGPSANVEPPNVLYACFNNSAHDEVALVMHNPTDTLVWDAGAQSDFAVNGNTSAVVSGSAFNNSIVLKLATPLSPGDTVSYAGHAGTVGPWVHNIGGVGLLAFYNVPIIATPPLADEVFISNTTGGTSNLALTFETQLGQLYSMEYCTDLSNPQWLPLSSSWGAGSPRNVLIPATDTKCFYRLNVIKPD